MSRRCKPTLDFMDERSPTRPAKPAGMLGAEIWVNIVAVGDPTPTDPTSFIRRGGSRWTRGRPIR